MKAVLSTVALLALGCAPGLAQGLDKSKPHGRACAAIMNVANGDEEVLRPASTAGKNQKIVVHLDATAPCDVLAVPFLKSGQAVAGWLPEYLEVSAGKETVAPKAPVAWSWENEVGPVEIYVVFLTRGSPRGDEMRSLVKAARTTKERGILKLQTGKLRELIGRTNFDREAALRAPKPSAEVAGTMRMVVGFEWRDAAKPVNFSPEKPGVLIFPSTEGR